MVSVAEHVVPAGMSMTLTSSPLEMVKPLVVAPGHAAPVVASTIEPGSTSWVLPSAFTHEMVISNSSVLSLRGWPTTVFETPKPPSTWIVVGSRGSVLSPMSSERTSTTPSWSKSSVAWFSRTPGITSLPSTTSTVTTVGGLPGLAGSVKRLDGMSASIQKLVSPTCPPLVSVAFGSVEVQTPV